jgi:hypothetical protein
MPIITFDLETIAGEDLVNVKTLHAALGDMIDSGHGDLYLWIPNKDPQVPNDLDPLQSISVYLAKHGGCYVVVSKGRG